MLTEAEAKTKWCPLARRQIAGKSAADTSPPINMIEEASNGEVIWQSPCIGSACMAWRWAHPSSTEMVNTPDKFVPPDEHNPPRLVPQPPEGEGWRKVDDPRQWFGWTNWQRPHFENAHGYCGEFGKPER